MEMKVPPSNIEMEMCIVGNMLMGINTAKEILVMMDPTWFYSEKCFTIYKILVVKIENRIEPDFLLACQWLTDAGVLADVGGDGFLKNCMDALAPHQVKSYIAELRKLYFDRQIIRAIYTVEKDPSPDNIEKLRVKREERDAGSVDGIINTKNCINKVLELLEPLAKGMYEIFGWKRGDGHIGENDEYHNAITAGDIITVGARPKLGKTVLATHMAVHFAVTYKEPVLWFTTEMSYEETLQRMLSPLSGVPGWKFRKRYWDKEGKDLKAIGKAANMLAEMNIYIVDKQQPTLSDVRAAMAATKAKMVIVDYLQVVNLEVDEEGRAQGFDRFLYGWKFSLRGLGAFGVALSQLAREVDGLSAKQCPQLKDLKGSGGIEQISNSVILIHGRNKKDRETKIPEVPEIKNVKAIEFIHAKHRTGKSDVSVQMIFDENLIAFFEWNNETAERYNKDIIPAVKKEKKNAKPQYGDGKDGAADPENNTPDW